MARERGSKIGGQFAARLIEMLESPAMRVLSRSGRRVLDRLEIELAHHAGKDNGKLPVTYDDFEAFGIDRHSIAPAIRETVALGFVEITEQGRAGNAEWRRPSKFRLTYKHTHRTQPTNEWRHIKEEDAKMVAQVARSEIKQKPSGGNYRVSVGETPLQPSGENPHYSVNGKTPTTTISRSGVPFCTARPVYLPLPRILRRRALTVVR